MTRISRAIRPIIAINFIAITILATATLCLADDAASSDSSLYVKVTLANKIKMSKLKPGELVIGSLSRDVYSSDRKLFPTGSPVQLTVDHLEKRRRPTDDHWPGVVKLFTPRHQLYPVFKTATVGQGDASQQMQVNLISVSRLRDVHATPSKKKSGTTVDTHGAVEVHDPYTKKAPTPTMILEATLATPPAPQSDARDDDTTPAPTLPSGTRCRILLLGDVSASKNKPGDIVRARLLEPITLDSKVVLPAGSLFEGKVAKRTPPRWLSRSGSLYLQFTELTIPNGAQIPITATLAGAELDRQSHTRIDSEGQLHGERPGKVWMAINIGVTAGLAKEVDDAAQLIIEAIVSTATDASTAGTTRIISSCVSGIYMATRKGRDVVLPRFTEMDISLDRPVNLTAARPQEPATVAAGGGK